jgi:hypothetical protein
MLNGDKVVLRPVRERDLAAFIDAHTEIALEQGHGSHAGLLLACQ